MTSTNTAKQVLEDLYGIDAELTRLYGELDDNFLVVAKDGEKRVLKIMHVGCAVQRVDLQYRAMTHLADAGHGLNLPQVVPTQSGQPYVEYPVDGVSRLVWSLDYCPGTLLTDFSPYTDHLMRSFGRTIGMLDAALESFTHPAMEPGHKWELTRAAEARSHIQHIDGDAAGLVDDVLRRFENVTAEKLKRLPHSVIHNDANDGNVLVNMTEDGLAVVDGLIDFGDMTYQPTICEVAIALVYAVIKTDDPLSVCTAFLEAYSDVKPLSGDEIAVLYDLIMTRLAVSIAIGAARQIEDPDDDFGNQDKQPAIQALSRFADRSPRVAECVFRQACSLPVIDKADEITRYIESNALQRAPVIRTNGRSTVLDLSQNSSLLGSGPGIRLAAVIEKTMANAGAEFGFGRYAEPRAFYNTALFDDPNGVSERRTVHLGIDVFCVADSPVFAPLDGTVELLANNNRELDYGPMIVLRHTADSGQFFFTLYGHLSLNCLSVLEHGHEIAAGQQIAAVGRPPENGNWPPHLHLQLILDLLDLGADFPGVAKASQQRLWCALSPNPACFFTEFDPTELRYS
jgi:Ser/Thr protein kinase RdoA (MazF antagonist)